MWQWVIKLIGGWIPTGSKPFGEYIGKILWAVGIYAACTLALGYFFPSKPNVINVAGNYISEKPDVAQFGCSIFRGYGRIGIRAK